MSFAAGSLVRARGREWVVLADSDDDLVMVRPLGGTDHEVTGILTALEVVEPARFALPSADDLGDARSARLLRDALRLGFRSSAGPFRSFGHLAVDPRPYQLVPLLMALRLDPVRLLIADDVGIGKTIEAALVARELLDQGDASRLAVLCPPHLAEQWRAELAEKFHIDAELVLASTAGRLERGLRVDQTIFDVHDHVIVSTDYIKADRRRADFLRTCPDLVIVDEAHTCAFDGTGRRGRQQRHELVKGLAADPDRHLILVTATPHSGKEGAFRSLLALLDPALADLPDDLSGREHETQRRTVARHLVQRRRADIRHYLDADTAFPERFEREEHYTLSPEYRALFDKVLAYARETVRDASGGPQRQRIRWWSALALLRSLASSPAAAAATLRSRSAAGATGTPDEADEVGRRTVMDLGDDDEAESTDVVPGADPDDPDAPRGGGEPRVRRRLLDFARAADALRGPAADHKLRDATTIVRDLVADGFRPIVFCRFIPTAEYVAEHLRDALRGVEVAAVTGTLPPEAREERIAALAGHERRVLVATDCLSEGINLQEHFDAVVHYDLSWNPTRHEQREGRVDRFGQVSPQVRVVTYFGRDNQIDGIVLEVLLRKHQAIRSALGVSVPVPGDSSAVVEAILEGLLLRQDTGGIAERLPGFDEFFAARERDLHDEWQRSADKEKASRTLYAQHTIRPDEVARELAAVREAVGSGADVEGFVRDALTGLGAVVTAGPAPRVDLRDAPAAVRDVLGVGDEVRVAFALPAPEGAVALTRTHPFVERLATHVLDTALDPHLAGVATRAGAMRTAAVDRRTTLLLARYRFHLVTTRRGGDDARLAEDAAVLAFEGAPDAPRWLGPDAVEPLLAATPSGNVDPAQAADFVAEVLDAHAHWSVHLDEEARRRADALLDAHTRVREAARARGVRFRVEPQLPADVLGVYVLLPVPKAR